MRKTSSIELQREHSFKVMFVAGLVVTGVFVACSGGGDFTSKLPEKDPDASIESGGGGSGAGGATGGSGGAGSGAVASMTGGSPSDGAGMSSGGRAPEDAGPDASDGGLPPPACVRDEDCAPFTCRGSPSCREGVCAPGDPCEPPTNTACTSECVRTATGASCVVMGRDGDRDGHRDARCDENPGDDCDDTQPTVFQGAPEICDGLDNDCNQKADVFDGLPLSGSGGHIVTTVTGTAQLGLVMRTSGYALLTSEMPDFYAGKGNPADVRFVSFTGDVRTPARISGSLNMADPAMAASGDDLVFFGFLNTGTENVLTMTRRLGSDGVIQEPLRAPPIMTAAQVWGRAIASFPNGDTVLAWAELPSTNPPPSSGGISTNTVTAANGPSSSSTYVVRLVSTLSRAYRPSIAVTGPDKFAVAWAEWRAVGSGDDTMVVHLSQPAASGSNRIDTTIDTFAAVSTSQYYGEVVRPQVAFDGTAYTVGARGPGGALRVTRVSTSGEILCGPTPITDIATWGAAASLVSTQQGVVLLATGITGDVVPYRVSQGATATPTPCTLQRGPVMNAPKKRVASSGVFESGQLRVSLGDPVILVGKDRAVIAAWVERDRTAAEAAAAGTSVQAPAESNRVVFGMFGPNLCD